MVDHDSLERLLNSLGSQDRYEQKFGKAWATALGWSSDAVIINDHSIVDVEVRIWGLFLDHELATIITTDNRGNSIAPSALYGYHHALSWGLYLSPDGVVPFHSQWQGDDGWYTLPKIDMSTLADRRIVLGGFTPERLQEGFLSSFARREYQAGRPLVPVDDALVNRLDNWRTRALKTADSSDQIDEHIQTTFAQLFVLRAVEDRGLKPSLGTLEECITEDGLDNERLQDLYRKARSHIQSELFKDDFLQKLSDSLIIDIIKELYNPGHLPWQEARYNFSWVEVDVLGRAYEKYLSNILRPSQEIEPQLQIWEQAQRGVDRIPARRKTGVYYTPGFLVDYLCTSAFRSIEEGGKTSVPRVIDFSCGSGSFLVEAAGRLLALIRGRGVESPGEKLVENQLVVGIDIDRRAVILARLSLWLRLAEAPDPLPLPALDDVVVEGDALNESTWTDLPDSYDIVIGNPPFLPTGSVPRREELEARFRSAVGRFDYAYLFVELGTSKLAPGGVLSLVIPNRLLINSSAEGIRKVLLEETDLEKIVDYGALEVFTGVETYVATLVVRKKPVKHESNVVRFTKVLDVPDYFASFRLLREEGEAEGTSSEYFRSYNTSRPSSDGRWLFLSPEDKRRRVQLSDEAEVLESLAVVRQGIKTGANDLFLFREVRSGPETSEFENGLGDVVVLEEELLQPATYGSEIRRYRYAGGTHWLLYPYRHGEVVNEQELESEYPGIFEYLTGYRGLLEGRSSISSSGYEWYELVRKRDEDWLRAPKLLTRDLSSIASFGVDEGGNLFLVGGTAIVPSDPELLLPLLGYLNSSIVDWFLDQAAPKFQSGFKKYEPRNLGRIPVPKVILDDQQVLNQLESMVLRVLNLYREGAAEEAEEAERAVDEFLDRAIGL